MITFIVFCLSEVSLRVSLKLEDLTVRAALEFRRPHLLENLVEPLQRTIQVQLNPAGGGSDCFSSILVAPSFYKRHPDGAHPGKVVHGFKPMVDRLAQQGCKLLVVEYSEIVCRRNLADSGRVPTKVFVRVG